HLRYTSYKNHIASSFIPKRDWTDRYFTYGSSPPLPRFDWHRASLWNRVGFHYLPLDTGAIAVIPFWCLALLFATPTAIHYLRRSCRACGMASLLCPTCGYD